MIALCGVCPMHRSEERVHLEKMLVNKLRDIMLQMDLEEVTSKQLRMQLEKEVSMELSEYKGFLDQEMLRILGQMERPSEIFDFLYLVSSVRVCACLCVYMCVCVCVVCTCMLVQSPCADTSVSRSAL